MSLARDPHQSFEEFFRNEYTPLMRAMLLATGNREEAEDLAQEAMARMFERWDGMPYVQDRVAYVRRTGINLYRKRLRRLRTHVRRMVLLTRDLEPPNEPRTGIEYVWLILDTLTPSERVALLLVDWLGLTAEDAGDLLGVKPVTIRSRLHRGRARLKRVLEVVDA